MKSPQRPGSRGAGADVAARRLLLAQARQRRLAFEQRAERRCGWHAPAAAADRAGAARRPTGRAARRTGRGRRRRPPRRSGSARIRSAGRRRRSGCARMRSTSWLGFFVALAERRASMRRRAAGAAAGRAPRAAGAPASRAPRPAGRAPSATRRGCVRPARTPSAAARRRARARRRPRAGRAPASQSRGARVQRRLCSAAGSAAKRWRSASRASACMRSQSLCFAGDEDRRVARQPREPLARVVARHERRAQLGMQRVDDRDRASGRSRSAGSRLASSRLDEAGRAARRLAAPSAGDLGCAHRRRRPSPTAPAAGRAASLRPARAGAPPRRGRRDAPKRALHELDASRRAGSAAAPGRRRVHCP